MLARLFVFFGGTLVVALCSLLLAPLFVDWAGYRTAFEREASRIIGQPVRVEGTAKARILPFPSVTFSNIVIEGADGIPAARIAAFSMDAELAPFLSGEILIFDMRIERPDVRIKLSENGALLWALPQSEALQGRTIALENVNVSDGRILVEKAGRQPMVVGGINGKISAQSLTGPWIAEGRFSHGPAVYDARLSTGAKIANETLRVRLSLAPQNGFYEAAFDGQLATGNNGAPVYEGKLDLSVLGHLQDAKGQRQAIADVKSQFSLDARGINLTDAALTAGPLDLPYRANGSASLSFGDNPRFDVTLKGQQISFGDIEGSAKADRVTLGVPLAQRLVTLENAVRQIPVPQMAGQIDLALPALVIGDTIIRNVEIKAEPAENGWRIGRYSVELPGRTIVEGVGDLTLAEGLAFNGQVTLASKQPTGLLNWLGIKANDAIRALPGAGFTSRADLSAKRQTLRDVEFRAGNAVLRGFIDRQVPENARPQVSLQLSGENADLDVLQGLVETQSDLWTGQDFDLAVVSVPVSGFGLQAEKLESVFRLSKAELSVEKLHITGLAGADIAVTGKLMDSFNQPAGTLNIGLTAIDPTSFLAALTARFPGQAWLGEATKRAGFMSTALADGSVNANVRFGYHQQPKPSLQGNLDYSFEAVELSFAGAGRFNGKDVSLNAKGNAVFGEVLLAGLGIPIDTNIAGFAQLDTADFDLSLASKSGAIESGYLKAASETDVLEASFGLGAQPFHLRLADATNYALSVGYVLPGAVYGLPLDLKGDWQNTGTALRLTALTGTLAEVPVVGDVEFITGERLKIGGNLKAQLIDRILIDEVIFGALSAGGDGQAEFKGGLPFDADFAFAADKATGFLPLDITDVYLRVIASKDSMRFADIKADLASGQFTGTGEARINGPEVALSFNGAVANADLSSILGASISGRGNLQIELGAAGATKDALNAAIVGSGILSAEDVVLTGVTTSRFKALVDEADKLQTAPDAVATLEMATRHVLLGQTQLPALQTAFTVTSGIARATRSLVKLDAGNLAFEPKLDVTSGAAQMTGSLLFDTGDETTTGTEPALNFSLTGSLNDLKLALDPSPLQGFLGQRALEREEARVEAIQSAILEKQRLRRENRYYAGLIELRAKAEAARLAEIDRLKLEAAKAEQERLRIERLEQQRVELERLELQRLAAEQEKALGNRPPELPAAIPLQDPLKDPLNLDELLKELETKPATQP